MKTCERGVQLSVISVAELDDIDREDAGLTEQQTTPQGNT